MKKLSLLFVVLLSLTATSAFAGEVVDYATGKLGYFSPDQSGFDSDFNLEVAAGKNLGDVLENLSAELSLGYYGTEAGPFEATIIPIMVSGIYTYPVGDPFSVYGGLGAGFAYVDADVVGSDFELTYQAIGGALYGLQDGLDLLGELKYTSVELADGDLDGYTFNVGVKYSF